MKLEEFPLDVLALFLNGDNSWIAIELWKCGNANLNAKLSRGAVTEVCLKTPRGMDGQQTTGRWPRCLKEFRLKKLYIERPDGLCSAKTLRSELQKLHSGLEELSLYSKEAPFAVFPSASSDPKNVALDDEDDAPRPTKRSKNAESTDGDRKHEEMWNLDITFPQLKKLTIFSPNDYRFSSSLFGCLPRSLTYFQFLQPLESPIDDFGAFPVGLRVLKLFQGSISEKALKKLPASIIDIGLSLSTAVAVELAKKPKMAPNLEIFPRFLEDDDYYDENPLSNAILGYARRSWPDTIRKLTLSSVRAEKIFGRPLPKNLTYLNIVASESKFDLKYDWLTSILPAGITRLDISTVDWSSINATNWPQSLTRLSINHDPNATPLVFHRLPRTLKHLIINPYRVDEETEWTEKLLSELNLKGRESIEGLDKDLWTQLKAKMRAHQFPNGNASAYIEMVESGGLFGLPLSLVRFEYGSIADTAPWTLLLPPQLQELLVVPATTCRSTAFFERLPPSLSDLQFSMAMDDCDCRVWEVFQTSDPTTSALYRANNLASLSISFNVERSQDFADDFFKYLPRTLRHLSWSCPEKRANLENLKSLPPRLESLDLDYRRTRFEGSWIEVLPRTLTGLYAGEQVMKGCEIEKLPPNLAQLRIALFDVTLSQLRCIPKTLTLFELNGADPGPLARTQGTLTPNQLSRLIQAYYPLYRLLEVSLEDNAAEMNISTEFERPEDEGEYDGKDGYDSSSNESDEIENVENYEDNEEDHANVEENGEEEENEEDDGDGDDEDDEEANEDEEGAMGLGFEYDWQNEASDIDPRTIRRIRGASTQ